MGNVVFFRSSRLLDELRVQRTASHRVSVRLIAVCDSDYSRWIRHSLAFVLMKSGGFRTLKEFTDQRWALHRKRHVFSVSHQLLGRFLHLVRRFVALDDVEVIVDGELVRQRAQIRAIKR